MNEVRALLLAAGLGTRLNPLTNEWPKCIMPIGERPLLEHWLETLHSVNVNDVIVNLHHHYEIVQEFLNRPRFKGWVHPVFEKTLLGTAGTLKANKEYFQDCTTLLVHADNWCQCDFAGFLKFHRVLTVLQSIKFDIYSISTIINLPINLFFKNHIEEINAIFGQQQIENIAATLSLIDSQTRIDKLNNLSC